MSEPRATAAQQSLAASGDKPERKGVLYEARSEAATGVASPFLWVALLSFVLVHSGLALPVATDYCAVCYLPIVYNYHLIEDQVTHQNKMVCPDCALKLPRCYLCNLPTLTNVAGATVLSDDRRICARDASTVVLSQEDGVKICQTVKDDLSRRLSRFLSFPDENVSFSVVDQIDLQALFKTAGNDYAGPNVFGFARVATNSGRIEHQVSVLSGLPINRFKATCVHECAHTWVEENLSKDRRNAIENCAEEAFCELLAYLYVDALGDTAAKARILSNAYTRGQIQVFVDTEKQFGLSDIVDWMKCGTDKRLEAGSRQGPGGPFTFPGCRSRAPRMSQTLPWCRLRESYPISGLRAMP